MAEAGDRGIPGTSRIAPKDRDAAMTESEFLERCSHYGVRCFIAGADWYFALGPNARREPGRAMEVTPEELARVVYHEQVIDGEPLKVPYASLSDPSRISFRYTEIGRQMNAHRRWAPKAGVGRRRGPMRPG